MFWELPPEDDQSCAKVEGLGQKMKNSPRTMQLREYTLTEFWEIFVCDSPLGADVFSGT